MDVLAGAWFCLMILKKNSTFVINCKYFLKLLLIMSIKSVQYNGARNNDLQIILDGDMEDTEGSWLGFWFLDNPEKKFSLCSIINMSSNLF